MCIKGLVYHLSHDCHFDIDYDVSTAHCRSSSGDSVGLLSQTICTTVVVSDWCITSESILQVKSEPESCPSPSPSQVESQVSGIPFFSQTTRSSSIRMASGKCEFFFCEFFFKSYVYIQ